MNAMREKAATTVLGTKVSLWRDNEGQWEIRTSDYQNRWEINPADAEGWYKVIQVIHEALRLVPVKEERK